MSLRSLEEQSSELRRREDQEDREQDNRERGEVVLHEWEEEGGAYRLVEAGGVWISQSPNRITGEWFRVFSATPLMREILRLRDQVRSLIAEAEREEDKG